MNCPNCERTIKDKKVMYCPYCGEPLMSQAKYKNLSSEDIEVIMRRDKNDELRHTGSILIIIGIFCLLIIFGLYLIIAGAVIKKEAKKNARNKHDLMYLDKSNNKVIFNSVDDREYVVDTKDIIKIYGSGFNDEVVATFIFKGKTKTINLGFAFKEDIAKAINFLKENKK